MCGVFERCKQGSYDEQGRATDPSTGPALTYLRQAPLMSGLTSYVFPRQAPLTCGALLRQAPGCGALPSTGPAYVWCGVVRCLRVSSTGLGLPYLLCVVPGLTYLDSPAYVRCGAVLCFAYERCSALLRQGPGCFDRPRLPLMCFAVLCLPSTGPGVLRQPPGVLTCLCPALLCLAWLYLTSTPPGLTSYAGCLRALLRHPPGVLCFALLACLLCLLTCLRVFYTY